MRYYSLTESKWIGGRVDFPSIVAASLNSNWEMAMTSQVHFSMFRFFISCSSLRVYNLLQIFAQLWFLTKKGVIWNWSWPHILSWHGSTKRLEDVTGILLLFHVIEFICKPFEILSFKYLIGWLWGFYRFPKNFSVQVEIFDVLLNTVMNESYSGLLAWWLSESFYLARSN